MARQKQQNSPLRLALRNSAVTLAIVGLAGVVRALQFWHFRDWFAWWVFVAVAVWIVIICFAHAFVGAAIGHRKADIAFLILLLTNLVALVAGLLHYGDKQ